MLIDVPYLLLGLFIIPWREPIPDLMRFDIPLFLKDGPRAGPISVLLSPVSLSHPLFPDASNALLAVLMPLAAHRPIALSGISDPLLSALALLAGANPPIVPPHSNPPA